MATETLLTRPRRPQKRAGRHCYSGDPPECRVRPPSRCLQQWEDDDRQTAGPPRRPCSLGEADGATLEPRGPLVHLACRFCYWVQRPARAKPSSPPLSRHPRSAALRPPTALPFLRGPQPWAAWLSLVLQLPGPRHPVGLGAALGSAPNPTLLTFPRSTGR